MPRSVCSVKLHQGLLSLGPNAWEKSQYYLETFLHLHDIHPTCIFDIFCAGDWVGLDVSRAAQRLQHRGRGSLEVVGLRAASGVREAFLEVTLKVTSQP